MSHVIILKQTAHHRELIYSLNGCSKFTEIDLADVYLQIELEKESKKLLVLKTYSNISKRLPFGSS